MHDVCNGFINAYRSGYCTWWEYTFMKNIKVIYNNDHSVKQYYNKSWQCEINDKNIPLTLVVEVVDMYGATGEEEYKDYNFVFTIGILNKKIHKSIIKAMGEDYSGSPEDMISYYGMNCHLDTQFQNTDELNQKLFKSLTTDQACLSQYKDRFTGKMQNTLKFKTEEEAFNFSEKLIHAYGNTLMTLVGFHLDKPINLIGQTAWEQTEKLHFGEV
jgi:hypothetical protein